MPRRDEVGPRPRLKERVRAAKVSRHCTRNWPRVDPESASKGPGPRDRQRIVRALEVLRCFRTARCPSLMAEKSPDFVPIEAVRLGLTLPRAILYDRIAGRIQDMVEARLGRGSVGATRPRRRPISAGIPSDRLFSDRVLHPRQNQPRTGDRNYCASHPQIRQTPNHLVSARRKGFAGSRPSRSSNSFRFCCENSHLEEHWLDEQA